MKEKMKLDLTNKFNTDVYECPIIFVNSVLFQQTETVPTLLLKTTY